MEIHCAWSKLSLGLAMLRATQGGLLSDGAVHWSLQELLLAGLGLKMFEALALSAQSSSNMPMLNQNMGHLQSCDAFLQPFSSLSEVFTIRSAQCVPRGHGRDAGHWRFD